MIINTETLEYPLTLGQVKKAHPNASMPRSPSDANLASLGYANVQPTTRPIGDVVTESAPEQDAEGVWHQTWSVRDFTADEAQSALNRVKERSVRQINDAYENELNAILKDYPEVETKTWDKQEREAQAWAADNTVATPLLTEIATARGMTLAELVPRVIAKADAWIQLSGAATGKRQALEEQIEAATTVEEVEAIQW